MNIVEEVYYFMHSAGQLEEEYDEFFRLSLLNEEFSEYITAVAVGDDVEIADGLADMIYVAVGTLVHKFGSTATKRILSEVCDSNLSKISGGVTKDGNGKVKKGPFYFPPEIEEIINA